MHGHSGSSKVAHIAGDHCQPVHVGSCRDQLVEWILGIRNAELTPYLCAVRIDGQSAQPVCSGYLIDEALRERVMSCRLITVGAVDMQHAAELHAQVLECILKGAHKVR